MPIPFLTALAIIALSARFALTKGLPLSARVILAAAGVVAAAEAVLVGVRFGYGVAEMIIYQRILPLAIGPLMYLGFLALASATAGLRGAAIAHLGLAAALITFFLVRGFSLPTLDFAIICSYAVYIILLCRLWRAGPDALTRARLSEAAVVRVWLLGAIGLLAFVLILDAAIAVAFAYGLGDKAPLLISFGTAVLAVLFFYALTQRPVTVTANAKRPNEIFNRIEALMRVDELFRDPDLTLGRLARRLGQPARAVSQAINAATGLNVSQYVNRHRIEVAAHALQQSSEAIETIAQDSGFLSRSNFYREFQRTYQITPAAYRKRAAQK